MKKFISVLLVTLVAMLGFGVPAFAEGEDSDPAAPAVVEPAPEPEPEPPKAPDPEPEPEPAPAPEPEPQVAPEEPEVAPEEPADGRDELRHNDPLGEVQTTTAPPPTSPEESTAPPPTSEPPKKLHKSYVCKYVSKPGEDERLQTGNNPIWVDNHSLPGVEEGEEVQVGDSFADGQERSVVIVANTEKLDPEPTIEDCPPPAPPEPLRETRPMETRDCVAGWARWTEERFSVPTFIDGEWVHVFSDNWTEVEGSRTVVDISDTDECQPPPPPPCPTPPVLTSNNTPVPVPECPPLEVVEFGEWIDGIWVCGDTTVTQTRTVTRTTTPYILVDNQWVLDTENAVVEVLEPEQQVRELTQEEIGECPLLPGDIAAVCVGDVPYLSYSVTPPEGFIPSSDTPLTITFIHPTDSDQDHEIAFLPMSGTILWPGASEGPPQMWPGWDTNDGGQTYFQVGDDNFGWTRSGVTVVFEVNPTFSTTVNYPAATAACANPPDNPNNPDNPDQLAFTGPTDTEGTIKLAGVLLLLGFGSVAVRRRWII